MPTTDLKNDVLSYIDNADDRLLKMIKALAESYQDTNEDTLGEIPPLLHTKRKPGGKTSD